MVDTRAASGDLWSVIDQMLIARALGVLAVAAAFNTSAPANESTFVLNGSLNQSSSALNGSSAETESSGDDWVVESSNDDYSWECKDFNNDDVDDFLVGAPLANLSDMRDEAGKVYVVYGSVALVSEERLLSDIGQSEPGFTVEGREQGDRLGTSVGGGADLNADGIDDGLVGAPMADNAGSTDAGSSFSCHHQLAEPRSARFPARGYTSLGIP